MNRPAPARAADEGAALRLDYVSPLPPVRSGIADYSRDLLPHLAALADVRVVRLPEQPLAPELEARWRPAAAALAGSDGRLPLYQMGNNRYHEAVLALALERPGVLTLHDVVLHHLLVEATLGRAEMEPYVERLRADHGWVGDLTARARQWGELGEAALFGLAAHRTLLRRQRGVLVHNRRAAAAVREEDPEIAVRVVPMAVPLPPPADREAGAAIRERYGVGAGLLLGSFGFQTPIKRTAKAIEALARPELAAAHLLVAGEVSPALDLEAVAATAGVVERVHFAGFLDYREFEAAIAACDLCLNLRYPTAGETSASLLRVLAVGRPAVVSDHAQAAELPEAVALRVPLGGGEVEALAAAVGALAGAPERLAAMSAAARDYVRREHDPAAAAAAVVGACRELAALAPPGDRPAAPPPPTSLVWRGVEGELEVEGAERPWPEGERRRLAVRLTNRSLARWLATRHEVGGLMVELQWRESPWFDAPGQAWLELARDLEPGETRRFEIEMRRPLGARMLIVEPHLKGVSGFNSLGGPTWVRVMA